MVVNMIVNIKLGNLEELFTHPLHDIMETITLYKEELKRVYKLYHHSPMTKVEVWIYKNKVRGLALRGHYDLFILPDSICDMCEEFYLFIPKHVESVEVNVS